MGQEKENAQERKICIESEAGTFNVSVSGTQEQTIIVADPFMAGGKVKIQGRATIQHWTEKGLEEGLHFLVGRGIYIQCPKGITEIREAIAELPHKKYWARKIKEVQYADGDNIEVVVWKFDCGCWTEKSTLISDMEMGRFLDRRGITEIEIDKATKMWADEKEEAHTKADEEGNKRIQAIFDDDEADAGYEQACENAGIPKFLQ